MYVRLIVHCSVHKMTWIIWWISKNNEYSHYIFNGKCIKCGCDCSIYYRTTHSLNQHTANDECSVNRALHTTENIKKVYISERNKMPSYYNCEIYIPLNEQCIQNATENRTEIWKYQCDCHQPERMYKKRPKQKEKARMNLENMHSVALHISTDSLGLLHTHSLYWCRCVFVNMNVLPDILRRWI